MESLIGLGVFLLVLYGLVRLLAVATAQLTGARHRAYRQIAQRYRGRYESRGLVDPPTVSFEHNGSAVRVGLAPVVQGQPSGTTPRTRVVARFGRGGLPFRLELMPKGRPAPLQPPKGTRNVPSGHGEFDRLYVIQANDPEIARDFLQPEPVRSALENLRRLALPTGLLLSVNPERMLIQVDRNLGQNGAALDLAVRETLILHDALQTCVAERLREGIDIVAAGTAPAEDNGPPECEVCGDPIAGLHVVCVTCRTPFHRDCWTFIGGCSTFGCQSKQCVSV